MLFFLGLIILNNSLGDIVTEVFELIVRECGLLSGFLLASISKTKWQGCFSKSAGLTSTGRCSILTHVELRGCHGHPPRHVALFWASPTKSLLLNLFFSLQSFIPNSSSLKHYFLVTNHRSSLILTVNWIFFRADNFHLRLFLKSRSFLGIRILLWLQVFGNFLFFLTLRIGNTCLRPCWRLFRWRLLGRSEWVAFELLTVHVWGAIYYFIIKSSGTSKRARNSTCETTKCSRRNFQRLSTNFIFI